MQQVPWRTARMAGIAAGVQASCARRGWGLLTWDKDWWFRGPNGAPSAFSKFSMKTGSQESLSGGWETTDTNWNGGGPTENRRMISYSDGSPAVEEAAQGGCAAFSLGGFQDLTGSNPEQPELTSGLILLWVASWTRDLLGLFPTWNNLWFITCFKTFPGAFKSLPSLTFFCFGMKILWTISKSTSKRTSFKITVLF